MRLIAYCYRRTFVFSLFDMSSAIIGSPDKYRGLPIATSLEGCTHRLADVGNRVHTRNDSDEDVRGYACKQAIAWKALP